MTAFSEVLKQIVKSDGKFLIFFKFRCSNAVFGCSVTEVVCTEKKISNKLSKIAKKTTHGKRFA